MISAQKDIDSHHRTVAAVRCRELHLARLKGAGQSDQAAAAQSEDSCFRGRCSSGTTLVVSGLEHGLGQTSGVCSFEQQSLNTGGADSCSQPEAAPPAI